MSGVPGADLTRVVAALQELIKAAYLTQQTLQNGVTVNTQLPNATVANLPTSAPVGMLWFATDGRNSGQGSGAGTGCVVVGSGSVWTAVWSGSQVLA